jgi:hypothetical protein
MRNGHLVLTTLRIRLIDDQDQAFDNLSYRLEVAGQTFEGITTQQGILEHQIPLAATAGKLALLYKPDDGDSVVFWMLDLEIADLAGSGELAGAQARLNNLGFFAGEQITSQRDEQTVRALQRFQTRFKVAGKNGAVDTSGSLTRLTNELLKEIYGS